MSSIQKCVTQSATSMNGTPAMEADSTSGKTKTYAKALAPMNEG